MQNSTESLADYLFLNLNVSEQKSINTEKLTKKLKPSSTESCETKPRSKAIRNNIFSQSIGLIKADKRRIKDIELQTREIAQFEDLKIINDSEKSSDNGSINNSKQYNSKTITTKKTKREWDKTKYWDAENEMWLSSETSHSNLYTNGNRSSRRSSNSIDSEDNGSSSPSYFGYR